MKITTKKAANGRTTAYYIDGKKVRKNEIDFHISDAAARGEIIEVDYYVGTEFRSITRSSYKNLKVVLTGMGELFMTQAAADELGYSVIREFTGSYFNTYLVEKKAETCNVEDYAVTTDTQDAATDAEIEAANNNSELEVEDTDNNIEDDIEEYTDEISEENDEENTTDETEEYTEDELHAGIEDAQNTIATHEDIVTVATAKYNIALCNLDLAKKEQRKAERAWNKLPYGVDEATNQAAIARWDAADKAVEDAEATVAATEKEYYDAINKAAKIREEERKAEEETERLALGLPICEIRWEHAFVPAETLQIAVDAEIELANKNAEIETTAKNNNVELPTGEITVKSGAEAWDIVGKHFTNGLNANGSSKGFNREDVFSYTNDKIIFVSAFCTPDNSRVECLEVINTNESSSKRRVLTVYINHDAETETATAGTNEQIINCTDDIIITNDAYTQMIRSEIANAQIASGNYGIEINGEWVYFTDHKITHIDAEDKLGFSFEYTWQGRKQFRHHGRVVSRDSIIKFFENKEIAQAQEKSFRKFFINSYAPHFGFFQVQVYATFADGCEHIYSRYFNFYNQAVDFVNDAIKFCADVPTHIFIGRNRQAGKNYYHRMPDGTIDIDKPDTDFFKHYSKDEIQSRLDDIGRAIADNKQFRNSGVQPIVGVAILNAIDWLSVIKNFYEFVLHENAPIVETDGSEEDDFTDELPALFPDEDNDDELIDPPIIGYPIDGRDLDDYTFIAQDGTKLIFLTDNINITRDNLTIKINERTVAEYKTEDAVKAALEYIINWRETFYGDTSLPHKTFDINDYNTIFDDFNFDDGGEGLTIFIPDKKRELETPDYFMTIIETLDNINAAAPLGWEIKYNGKNFPVEFNCKTVATLDSLALAKVLPPDKFFEQFKPNISPREQFLDDRRKELDMLLDMRKFVEDDPERWKTLSDLIEDTKRAIVDAELSDDEPPDAPPIEYDEHGEIIPFF